MQFTWFLNFEGIHRTLYTFWSKEFPYNRKLSCWAITRSYNTSQLLTSSPELQGLLKVLAGQIITDFYIRI